MCNDRTNGGRVSFEHNWPTSKIELKKSTFGFVMIRFGRVLPGISFVSSASLHQPGWVTTDPTCAKRHNHALHCVQQQNPLTSISKEPTITKWPGRLTGTRRSRMGQMWAIGKHSSAAFDHPGDAGVD
jgi:hypothetical protein